MRPFGYERVSTVADAAMAASTARAAFLAGGTTLIDLMKLDVMRPAALVDINGLPEIAEISAEADQLRLGALARMADAADHPEVRRDYPVIAQSLQQAASAQLRNM